MNPFPPRLRLIAAARFWLLAGLATLALAVMACSSGSSDQAKAPATTPTIAATANARPKPAAAVTSTAQPTTVVETPEVTPTDTAAAQASAPTPPPPPPPADTPVPPPPADAAQVLVVPPEIGQGQTAAVEVAGQVASSAMAFCDDVRYPLVMRGSDFWGVIAAAGDARAGVHAVTVQLFDANGNLMASLAAQVTVDDMGYPVENVDLPADVNNSLDPALIQQENDARAATFAQFTSQKLWSGPFIWPVAEVIVDPFGIRRSYNGGPVSSFHQGIDLAADEGVAIVASNSGRVAYVASGPTHGNSVLIDHGDGVFSGYGHMSRFNVQVGQMVSKGDVIGYVGSTGMATGPHVHWEIIVRGVPVDPMPWTLQTVGP